MRWISENTKSIQHSKIRRMYHRALQYDHIVNLSIGEPDFTPAANVEAAACQAVKEGKSKYSHNAGILPLREEISQYLHQQIGVTYNATSEIIVTTGAMGALYQALKVILNPSDEVIVSEPCWNNYVQQILMCGGTPVRIASLDNGFSLDTDAVREAVTEKTKAIIINSPSNPTGAVLDKDVLDKVADIAKEYDLLVISDEVYRNIIYEDTAFTSIAQLPRMQERTLVVDSFSKTFAMTGFRVGFAAGPNEVIANMTKLQENICACAPMPSQYAALEALKDSGEHAAYMTSCYQERRNYITERLAEMPSIEYEKPKGTFYAFPSIKKTKLSSEEFALKLLEEEQVVVVPGDAFGTFGEGYIRISYAASMEELKKGMDGLERFLRRLASD